MNPEIDLRSNIKKIPQFFQEPIRGMTIHIGLDIGGTLAKVVCVAEKDILKRINSQYSASVMTHEKYSADEEEISPTELGFTAGDADLGFGMYAFGSRNITPLLEFLELLFATVDTASLVVPVTGGGALKFRREFEEVFPHVVFHKVDEIDAIAKGFSFLVQRPNSAFIFESRDCSVTPVPAGEVDQPFPLLLVNIGSGVSMIKIRSATEYERVQGSPIGGGTVLGLGKALFNADSFEEIMNLSMAGDSSRVDLSVGELIGASPNDDFWNLDTVASSLTKLLSLDKSTVSRADLAQSIVRMVSYNIGYVAYLVACLHKCERIYFSGKYVNKHIPTMDAISYAVKFYENWKPPPIAEESLAHLESGNEPNRSPASLGRKCEVRFLHQEGYVGAIGALLYLQ